MFSKGVLVSNIFSWLFSNTLASKLISFIATEEARSCICQLVYGSEVRTSFLLIFLSRYLNRMNRHSSCLPPRVSVEITDEEHTLILMMRLDEITYVMMLNRFLPNELVKRSDHITNIINWYFHKSYELHTVKTMIEFISTHPMYNQMFQHRSLDEIIRKYQSEKVAESEGVNEFYLKPYTTQCIQCKTQLNPTFSHRSKTVMSLVRTYKARKL